MINQIVSGISIALDAAFTGVTVYVDEIKQGMNEPSFYIKVLASDQQQIIGSRYHRRQSFDVHYFPSSETEANVEINGALAKLYDALEYITMGTDLVRAKTMRHEVQGGVLHFLVEYDLIVIKQKPRDDEMEILHINP